jgi:predicted nucleotidyltransferase
MKIGYDTYKVFLDELLKALKDDFGEGVILSFALFGSVARGEARPDSDIDLLIVHKPIDFDPIGRLVKLLLGKVYENDEYKRLQSLGLSADPYPIFMTEKDLYERPLILLDIQDHGIVIYDNGTLNKRFISLRKRLNELGSKKIALNDGTWYWDIKPDWKPGEVIEL